MANWDPQPPVDQPNESVYDLTFNYNLDPSHRGPVHLVIEGIQDPDNLVVQSLVEAISAADGWTFSYSFRIFKLSQRLDDSI